MSNELETAFIIVREADGSFTATTDLEEAFMVNRAATVQDIRQACIELLNKLNEQSLANAVAARMLDLEASESEKAARAIRKKLEDKGLA